MRGFGELEAVIMDRLWTWGRPATGREVVDDLLRDREIAYTTVATVMENLRHKGWLDRERDGRAWRYATTMSREEYTADLMHDALGVNVDRAAAFMHFVERMTEEESQSLRVALRRASRRRG